MVKVFRYGSRINVVNPVNPHQVTAMINVTFVEEGRRGANYQVADSAALLDRVLAGELNDGDDTTSLDQLRIHTQPIREDKLHLFPIGREFPTLFINRTLYSTPQMRQQTNVKPRMIDSRPTFFATVLAERAEEDVDKRLSNDVLATIHPEYFAKDIVSQSALTIPVEQASPRQQQEEMDLVMNMAWASDAPDGGASLGRIDQGGADLDMSGPNPVGPQPGPTAPL